MSPPTSSFAGGCIPVRWFFDPSHWPAENGGTYPLRIRAVSDIGEIVTEYLVVSHQSVHVRLILMGDGYRAAGPWHLVEQRKRDVASALYFGEHSATNWPGIEIVRDGGARVMASKAEQESGGELIVASAFLDRGR